VVRFNYRITLFYRKDTAIDDDAANIIYPASMTSLAISSDSLSSQAWANLAKNSTLAGLFVNGKNIDDTFAEVMSHNSYIQGMSLDSDNISVNGYKTLFTNTHLTHLFFENFKNSDNFFTALEHSKFLKYLRLDIEDENIDLNGKMGHQIASGTGLTQVIVHSYISYDSVIDVDFVKEIIASPTITNLSIDNKSINDEHAKILATSPTLTSLTLNEGTIGNAGAIALANNQKLQTLDLLANDISDEGALAFIDNTSLDTLNLAVNKISPTAVTKLQASSSIKHLFLDYQLDENKLATKKKPIINKYFSFNVK
jgi:hypothetical protein